MCYRVAKIGKIRHTTKELSYFFEKKHKKRRCSIQKKNKGCTNCSFGWRIPYLI